MASTGLHLETLYAEDHWSQLLPVDELAERFIADVVDGIDANDYHATTVVPDATPRRRHQGRWRWRVERRGTSASSRPPRRRIVRPGVPILTHCTDGTAALEQVRLLTGAGVPAAAITLSHTDKVVDRAYHREILSTGVSVEYDQAFRWPPGADNGTLTLLGWMLEDGFGDQLMLGPRRRPPGLLERVWWPPGHGLPARRRSAR